jgi:hypothetical protein
MIEYVQNSRLFRIGLRLILTILLCVAVCAFSVWPAVASNFSDVDRLIEDAARAQSVAMVEQRLVKAAGILSERASQLQSSLLPDEISSRSHIVEGLQRAASYESKGEVLEALRFLVRVRDLCSSLAETERPPHTSQAVSLDSVTQAIYERIRLLGRSHGQVVISYAARPNEVSLYKSLFLDDSSLISFELIGYPKSTKAEWRRTKVPTVSAELQRALLRRLPRTLPFSLVVYGSLVPNTIDAEKHAAALSSALLERGIVPIAILSSEATRPLTRIPFIDEADLSHANVNATLLVHNPTGAVIRDFSAEKDDTFQDVREAAINEAIAVETDLEIKLDPAVSNLEALIERPTPADVSEGRPASKHHGTAGTSFKAVLTEHEVALVDEDRLIPVTPYMALTRLARFGDHWGQFQIEDNRKLVWLRNQELGAFIEYPHELRAKSGILKFFRRGGETRGILKQIVSAARLLAQPQNGAEQIQLLSTNQEVELLFEQPEDGDRPRWAFVRVKGQVGWVQSKNIKGEEAPEVRGLFGDQDSK